MNAGESGRPADGEPQDDEPFALELDEFIALQIEPPQPLLGDKRNTILPLGGLAIIAGKEKVGKTTLILDLIFHLASGMDWLGWEIPHPANVCILENEGPQHAFREKLREKREVWQARRLGRIYVQTWSWGTFRFDNSGMAARAREFFDENEIQLVVGDPLDALGVKGVGSPEDVRNFIELLVPLGLKGDDRAFMFLHHLRKEAADDELDQISGVWGRPADAIITVKHNHRPDQIRVNPVALRHAHDTLSAICVGMVRNMGGFELLGEEGDPRLLESEITELLADGTWRTYPEIAEKAKGGIGGRSSDIKACLIGNSHLFVSLNGREVGRSAKAVVWQLRENEDLRPDLTGGSLTLEKEWRSMDTGETPNHVPEAWDESGRVDLGEPETEPW